MFTVPREQVIGLMEADYLMGSLIGTFAGFLEQARPGLDSWFLDGRQEDADIDWLIENDYTTVRSDEELKRRTTEHRAVLTRLAAICATALEELPEEVVEAAFNDDEIAKLRHSAVFQEIGKPILEFFQQDVPVRVTLH